MASEQDWANAYLAQARADLDGAKAMVVGGVAPSVLAMLLQMVFEKLAKAALLRSGAVDLQSSLLSSHAAASRFLLVLYRERSWLEPIGGTKTWGDVLGVVDALERAHPNIANGRGPQLEYPWETPSGVKWPARDLPIAASLGDPSSNLAWRVVRFASLLCERFDQICP